MRRGLLLQFVLRSAIEVLLKRGGKFAQAGRREQSPAARPRQAIASIVTNAAALGKKERIKKEGFGLLRNPLCLAQISLVRIVVLVPIVIVMVILADALAQVIRID
jgi:hypothetical protein